MSPERSALLRAGFAVGDGLFAAAIVLLATTITPVFAPATSFAGVVVLMAAGVCAVGAHLVARRRDAREAVRSRSGRQVAALWLSELLVIVVAVAVILGGGHVGWAAASAGFVGALMSFTISGARAVRTTQKART